MFKKLLSLYVVCLFNSGTMLGEYFNQNHLIWFLTVMKYGEDMDIAFNSVRMSAVLRKNGRFWTSAENKPIGEPDIPNAFTGEWGSFEVPKNQPVFFDSSREETEALELSELKEPVYTTLTLKNQKAVDTWNELIKGKSTKIELLAPRGSEPRSQTTCTSSTEFFFRYSRPLGLNEPEKLHTFEKVYKGIFSESGVPMVRVIDYESILEGLKAPELVAEARALMNSLKTDQVYFRSVVISKWINPQKPILVKMDVKSELDGTCTEFLYKPTGGIPDVFVDCLCNTLAHEETVYQQTMVLALILLDHLRFVIDNTQRGASYCATTGAIYLPLCNGWLSRYFIYHELNHALHYHLGIVGAFYETDETCNALQKGLLFPNSEKLTIPEIGYPIQHNWFWELFHRVPTDHVLSNNGSFFGITKFRNLYRALEIALLWGNNEELWNGFGFMQIGNTVLINRLSDINFMLYPIMFYSEPAIINAPNGSGSRFQDFIQKCCPALNNFVGDRFSLQGFCKNLEAARDGDSKRFKSIIPSINTLRTLLFLQNRDPNKTMFEKRTIVGEFSHLIWHSLKFQ